MFVRPLIGLAMYGPWCFVCDVDVLSGVSRDRDRENVWVAGELSSTNHCQGKLSMILQPIRLRSWRAPPAQTDTDTDPKENLALR